MVNGKKVFSALMVSGILMSGVAEMSKFNEPKRVSASTPYALGDYPNELYTIPAGVTKFTNVSQTSNFTEWNTYMDHYVDRIAYQKERYEDWNMSVTNPADLQHDIYKVGTNGALTYEKTVTSSKDADGDVNFFYSYDTAGSYLFIIRKKVSGVWKYEKQSVEVRAANDFFGWESTTPDSKFKSYATIQSAASLNQDDSNYGVPKHAVQGKNIRLRDWNGSQTYGSDYIIYKMMADGTLQHEKTAYSEHMGWEYYSEANFSFNTSGDYLVVQVTAWANHGETAYTYEKNFVTVEQPNANVTTYTGKTMPLTTLSEIQALPLIKTENKKEPLTISSGIGRGGLKSFQFNGPYKAGTVLEVYQDKGNGKVVLVDTLEGKAETKSNGKHYASYVGLMDFTTATATPFFYVERSHEIVQQERKTTRRLVNPTADNITNVVQSATLSSTIFGTSERLKNISTDSDLLLLGTYSKTTNPINVTTKVPTTVSGYTLQSAKLNMYDILGANTNYRGSHTLTRTAGASNTTDITTPSNLFMGTTAGSGGYAVLELKYVNGSGQAQYTYLHDDFYTIN